MKKDIFRSLQKQLDTYSLGFPATESGVEIEILESLFSPEEAELFTLLSPRLETSASVASRTGLDEEELSLHLEDMASRGLLFRRKKGEEIKYGAIPFMHGLLEFQINNFDHETALRFEKYFDEALNVAISGSAEMFLRPIPIEESFSSEQTIAPFEDARGILENASLIVVADCICRKEKKTVGKGCGKPMETCFMFGSMAQYYLDNNMGREVSTDEAIAILKNAQEHGMVTQPATARNPAGMCSCCGDCCGVLLSLKKQAKPAELVFSNYYASVDEDTCSGCGTCIERCQMEAIELNDNGVAYINRDRCIGCGLCVPSCPLEAMQLERKDSDFRTPPATSLEQMLGMAKKRGVI